MTTVTRVGTSPGVNRISLDQLERGIAFISIELEGSLAAETGAAVAADVERLIDGLHGRPFGVLFDLRKVQSCDAGGAAAMQRVEMNAARRGLEKVAHLVAQRNLVEQATREMQKLGGAQLIATFDDEVLARRFASGLGAAE